MGYPKIILLRHGETLWNREGRYQGQKDSPLTPKGEHQARENAHKILKYINNFDKLLIFSSPLGRAKSTAFILCDELGIHRDRISFDKSIQEFNFGIFEGKTKAFCQEHYADVFNEREANKWFYEIEQGESYVKVAERLKSWLMQFNNKQTLLVIAHEMINRILRGLYLGLSTEETLTLRQPNSVVFLLHENREEIVT
jgi:probable phosphoglycerate mutase